MTVRARKNIKRIICFLAVFSLEGCITYKHLPFDPVEEFQNVEARSSENLVLEICNFYQDSYFPFSEEICMQNGLSLAEANSLALFYSPEILKARSELNISKAVLIEAGAPKNPEVFLGPRLSTQDGALKFPGALTFEVLLSNWRIPLRAAAIWEKEKNLWLLLEKEIEVLASIQKKFLEVDADRKREAIAKRQISRTKDIMLWVKSHYSSGEMDLLSYQIALRGLEDAKIQLMNSILSRKKSERELLKIIGLLPNSKVRISFDHLPLLDFNVDGLDLEQLIMNPALQAIEVEYYAAEQRLRVEIGKQLPALQLGPNFEYEEADKDFSLGLGLGFDLPIFTQNRSPIAVAEENRNRVRIRFDEKLLNLAEMFANFKDELQFLNARILELASLLGDSKILDRNFFNSFQYTKEGVLQALAASNSIGTTYLEEIELKKRIGQLKIDLLVISASLLPENCLNYVKEQGNDF